MRGWLLLLGGVLLGLACGGTLGVGGTYALLRGGPGAVKDAIVPDNRTLGDLVQHFKKNGVEGEFQPHATFLNPDSKEAGGYKTKDGDILLTRYGSESSADSSVKTGWRGQPVYRRGKLTAVFYGDTGKTARPIFEQF